MATTSVNTPLVKVKSLHCPGCGGPIELRGFAHTLNVVCPQCNTVLDASTPLLNILQAAQSTERIQPRIPLGSRGTFDGTVFEVIGFQVRGDSDSGDTWDEYLLFNPYKGFRYLSEFQGHWNYIRVLPKLPEAVSAGMKPVARMDGRRYSHFDHAFARTGYVIGEFPWQLNVGEAVTVNDYISVPYMLSSEATGAETIWSLGEYRTGAQIWQAFQLPDAPPPTVDVFGNQPSPYTGKVGPLWRKLVWMLVALAAVAFLFTLTARNERAFRQDYVFTSGTPAANAAFVTPSFELKGGTTNVEVATHTNLDNHWVYLAYALINEQTGQTFDFAREVSYYHSDDTEGSRNDSVVIPHVPSGSYILRVEPELDPTANAVEYEVVVTRGVATYFWFWIAAGLMCLPPIWTTVRSAQFEANRWRNSDHPPVRGSA